jgi:hypothetical protein
MGAYQLLAANGCLLYVGSATSPRGLRKRLCEHLTHVQAGEHGDQHTAHGVWCKAVVTADCDQALVLELLTQRILHRLRAPRLGSIASPACWKRRWRSLLR